MVYHILATWFSFGLGQAFNGMSIPGPQFGFAIITIHFWEISYGGWLLSSGVSDEASLIFIFIPTSPRLDISGTYIILSGAKIFLAMYRLSTNGTWSFAWLLMSYGLLHLCQVIRVQFYITTFNIFKCMLPWAQCLSSDPSH